MINPPVTLKRRSELRLLEDVLAIVDMIKVPICLTLMVGIRHGAVAKRKRRACMLLSGGRKTRYRFHALPWKGYPDLLQQLCRAA